MKAAKKKIDRLFSAYAILHDARCVQCGAINSTLQGGHLFHRTKQSVRWDFRNCFCQCASCNAKHELNFLPLYRVAVRLRGQEVVDELESLSNEESPQADHDWIREMMMVEIGKLPRWGRITDSMRKKVLNGTFTNKELIASIHGYSI